ncbi:MAG: fumarylacetoacetate hydrolase family protein, partial [Alphaproteobacteria bacterium]
MRICRFDDHRVGLVNGDIIADVTDITALLPAVRWPLEPGDIFIRNLATLGPALEGAASGAAKTSLSEVSLLAPVANPGKIISVGVPNHTGPGENWPATDIFLMSPDALAGAGAGLVVDRDQPCHLAIALAVVIGAGGRNLAQAEAPAHVAGYTIGLTVTGDDGAQIGTIIGPLFVTADEFNSAPPAAIGITVNGENLGASDLPVIAGAVPGIVALASSRYRLDPGDIIRIDARYQTDTDKPEAKNIRTLAAGD